MDFNLAQIIISNLPLGVKLELPPNLTLAIAKYIALYFPKGRVLSINAGTPINTVKNIVLNLKSYSILHVSRDVSIFFVEAIAQYAPAGITIELPNNTHVAHIDAISNRCVNHEVGLVFRPGVSPDLLIYTASVLPKNVTLFVDSNTPPDVVQEVLNASEKNKPLIFVESEKYYELVNHSIRIKPSHVQSSFFYSQRVAPFVCLNNQELNYYRIND